MFFPVSFRDTLCPSFFQAEAPARDFGGPFGGHFGTEWRPKSEKRAKNTGKIIPPRFGGRDPELIPLGGGLDKSIE